MSFVRFGAFALVEIVLPIFMKAPLGATGDAPASMTSTNHQTTDGGPGTFFPILYLIFLRSDSYP